LLIVCCEVSHAPEDLICFQTHGHTAINNYVVNSNTVVVGNAYFLHPLKWIWLTLA